MLDNYKCDNCGEPAILHYKEIINGKQTMKHYCAKCSKKFGVTNIFGTTLSTISSIFSNNSYVPAESKNPTRCKCGMTYNNILTNNLFGCSECYNIFDTLAKNYVEQLGGKKHRGSRPSECITDILTKKMQSDGELTRLKEELNKAISERRFIDCENIDKKIREMEGEDSE